jgi:drug/metabolite transporter (DMT)-like permease
MIQQMRIRGALYGLTAAAIWGGMYVVSDLVLAVIPPFSLLTIRLGIGATILGVMLARSTGFALSAQERMRLLRVGLIGFGISVGLQFVGTRLASAINGSVVTSASPAFILFFAWLLLREKLTVQRLIAVGLATVGVLVILDLGKFDLSSTKFVGNLALAGAAVTWALYSVLVRQASARHGTVTLTFWALLGGLLFTIPAAGIELTQETIKPITGGVILGIGYLGVISTAVAMVFWNRAFALVEASTASLFFFAQPLVGVILSTTLLSQPITPPLVIGGALIIAGVLLSILAESNAAPSVSEEAV